MRTPAIILLAAFVLMGASLRADEPPADAAALAFFNESVLPILENRCYECHSHAADEANGGLVLDARSGWEKGGDRGPSVQPGMPDESLLIQAIRYSDADLQMPPDSRLSDAEIAILEKWVRDGAVDPRRALPPLAEEPDNITANEHWAFQPLRASGLPTVHDPSWPLEDIDHFILARLEQQQLKPVSDADRATWLRRVTLDLTGLPPTPEDIQHFIEDTTPQAYERVVDRLLQSPAFGERWGRHWLDLVGYADQIGTANDLFAEHAWRYRDYVIDAFNGDVPYDQFVTEQIAGDLLPHTGTEQRYRQLVATGFLVLGDIAVVEADKEKLRADVIDQQVDKLGKAFLAMTIGCARCHDHKFDPVSQRDYYALAGFFYSTESVHRARWGVWSGVNVNELPETDVQKAEREARTQKHREQLAAWQTERDQATARRGELESQLKALDPASTESQAPAGQTRESLQKEIEQTTARINQLNQWIEHGTFFNPDVPRAFGVRDAAAPANMRITVRGNAHVLGDEVPRGFPAGLKHAPDDFQPPATHSGRLELARWITDPGNPLTSRVAVNRVWQKLFGAGLVPSVDYFGLRGDQPSHPELLDHLALRFMQEGWSQKALIRRLVLSRTYRMASDSNAHAAQVDPENRYLWRMNRWRLDAEALRDSVLAVSGRLMVLRPGPSLPLEFPENVGNLNPDNVNPPSFRLARFRPDQEFQRTIYLPIIRSGPQPGPADVRNVFDFTQPAQTAGERPVTAVPTQALYLMNGSLLRQRASDLASLIQQSGSDEPARLTALWLRVLARQPTTEEQMAAQSFLTDVRTTIGDEQAETRELRAWAELCHALLASSEFLMRL